jgi:energy-coupling factor transport system permease protein
MGIALANSLANPRKLLKSTPSALYEIASAISVAINLAPQLISSLQRVRRAGALRGRSKGLSSLAGTVIPVLEDTIENSLSLAASMDARGFGRQGSMTKGELSISRLTSMGSLLSMIFGMFFLLSGVALPLSIGLMLLGLVLVFVAMRLAAKRNIRTRFQPRRLSRLDLALAVVSTTLVIASSFGWWLR